MNKEKTVSVIVPNYNNEKYLTDCINSIFRQTYPIYEVIVVDDCSVDCSIDTLNGIKEAIGDKLKIISLPRNFGVSHARNVGLAAARGEYISTLDADDCWADEFKLRNEMNLISRYEQMGKEAAAYSKVLYMDDEGRRIENKKERKCCSGNIFFRLLNTADTRIVPRDYCVKTERARALGGWREDMSLYEDYEFTLRLSKQIEFADTYEDGILYRLKKNGLSDKSWKISNKVFWQVFSDNVRSLPWHIKIGCYLIKIFSMINQRLKTEIYNWVIGWK